MKIGSLAGIVSVVALALSTRVAGQPLFGLVDSLDLTVRRADRIVVGRVTVVGTEIKRDVVFVVPVVMTIEDTLKGDAVRQLPVDLYASVPDVQRWRDRASRLLVAVNATVKLQSTIVDLTDDRLAVFTADFVKLTTADAVIRSARSAVAGGPAGGGPVDASPVTLSPDLVKGTRWESYAATRMLVPADARLERRAHDILRERPSSSFRHEAVSALRYFKSDENIQLLRSCLDDPSSGYQEVAEQNEGVEVKVYPVRELAYQILTSWGMTVTKPVTREEAFKPELVTLIDRSNRAIPGSTRQVQTTAAELRSLKQFPNLKILVLSNDELTADAFRELASMTNLRELNLAGSNVNDDVVRQLAALTNLEALVLMGTRTTDAALEVIGGWRSLKKISLEHTRVTPAAITALRARRPDLEIRR